MIGHDAVHSEWFQALLDELGVARTITFPSTVPAAATVIREAVWKSGQCTDCAKLAVWLEERRRVTGKEK